MSRAGGGPERGAALCGCCSAPNHILHTPGGPGDSGESRGPRLGASRGYTGLAALLPPDIWSKPSCGFLRAHPGGGLAGNPPGGVAGDSLSPSLALTELLLHRLLEPRGFLIPDPALCPDPRIPEVGSCWIQLWFLPRRRQGNPLQGRGQEGFPHSLPEIPPCALPGSGTEAGSGWRLWSILL